MDSKYIKLEDIKKMRNFYCGPYTKDSNRNRRINVLMKNFGQVLKNIVSEKKILHPDAREEFNQMVQDFFQKCKQEKYSVSYDLLQLYKKAMIVSQKSPSKEASVSQVDNHTLKPQVLEVVEPKKNTFWGNLKTKLNTSKRTVVKGLKYAAATGLAVLSFGNCNTASFLQNKKVELEKNQLMSKPKINNLDTTFVLNKISVQQTEKKDSLITPYQVEFCQPIKDNEQKYKQFVHDLINQFRENISTLQNAKTNRKKFYKEQENLIAKYGKSAHIIPQSSCESMSYATFLKVLDNHSNPDDYVASACKDLLLRVPNPHACHSNKKTFKNYYSKNLRKTMEQEFQYNKYGIYMVWVRNKLGNLHRMTMIGAGDKKVYLLAYNNNRIVRMNIDKMDKLTSMGGYICNLGESIKSRANDLAILKNKQKEKIVSQNYIAVFLQNNKTKFS